MREIIFKASERVHMCILMCAEVQADAIKRAQPLSLRSSRVRARNLFANFRAHIHEYLCVHNAQNTEYVRAYMIIRV